MNTTTPLMPSRYIRPTHSDIQGEVYQTKDGAVLNVAFSARYRSVEEAERAAGMIARASTFFSAQVSL